MEGYGSLIGVGEENGGLRGGGRAVGGILGNAFLGIPRVRRPCLGIGGLRVRGRRGRGMVGSRWRKWVRGVCGKETGYTVVVVVVVVVVVADGG